MFGPNAHYRDKVFELVLKNRELFEHGFLEEHDRKTMRRKSAEQLLHYGKYCPQTYSEYLKNPNGFSLCYHALCSFDGSLAVKLGAHLGLYGKVIEYLGLKHHQKYA